MVAGLTMDQFVAILQQAGIPLIIGTFVSGIVQQLKISPSIPFVQQGSALLNRVIVVLLCLVVQVGFSLIHHDPITWTIIGQTLLSYYGASTAYGHFFQFFNSPSA